MDVDSKRTHDEMIEKMDGGWLDGCQLDVVTLGSMVQKFPA